MKILSSFILSLIVTLNGFSQESLTNLDLDSCINLAIQNNLNVQRGALQVESAHLNLQKARADLLPSLNAGITHGINQGRSIDPLTNSYINHQVLYASPYLDASLLLFNGLKFQNLIKQNSLIYKAEKQEEQQAKDDLTLNVTLIYLQVLTNKELLVLAKSRGDITLKQLDRLETLNKNGTISPASYYDVKGQYASDRISVINARNNLESSKISLAELLNIPYSEALTVKGFSTDQFILLYNASAEDVYASASQNYAAIKAADLRNEAVVANIKAIRAAYLPSLYFNTGLSSNFSNTARDIDNQQIRYFNQLNNNLNKGFSISLRLPIFNSFRTKNTLSLAKLNLRESELERQTVRTQLQRMVEQAYFNMVASKERYAVFKDQEDAFAESFRIAEIRFNEGVINSVEYLQTKKNMDIAQSSVIANRYDFILRKKILDLYQGNSHGL